MGGLLGCSFSVQALDATTGLTAQVLYVTTQLTQVPFDDDKRILRARDDAALFLGSGGAVRTARLEAALNHLRTRRSFPATDEVLAEAILIHATP